MREIVIVGAGPAGSLAALLLARAGLQPTLIEQHCFPRDKVCGECLAALGIEVLRRAGLTHKLHAIGPAILTHVLLHGCHGKSVAMSLPSPIWGISRRALDQLLLDAARADGAMLHCPARCENMHFGPQPTLRVRDSKPNITETLGPKYVLLADGKGMRAARAPAPTGDFGIKAHFCGINGPGDAVELFGCCGLYGGLAAIEGGRWNIALSVPAERLCQSRGAIDALFREIIEENPTLSRRLRGARRISRWLAAPLPRFGVSGNWCPGMIPIGNAAAALEPIGGEGISLALRSAELAVQTVLSGADAHAIERLRSEYRRLWRIRAPACRAGAIFVSHPRIARASVPLLKRFPSLEKMALGLAGK